MSILGKVIVTLLLWCPMSWAQSVELTVVPSSQASFGAAQQWAQALRSLRDVRVRSSTNQRPREDVKWMGSTLYITAIIGAQDKLIVPGKAFTIRQTTSLEAWIEAQKTAHRDGDQEAKDQRFGLTATQIQQVHELLKPTVIQSTKDVNTQQCLQKIIRKHNLPIQIDRQAQATLSGPNTQSKTEWQGFSSGTAIAGLLRQHQLAMVPQVTSGRVQLLVQPARLVKDSWPVGWPPELKKQDLVPKLFDTLPVEIHDTPVRDVMRALESRLETPILFDEGVLAAAGLNPDQTKVTVELKRSFYGKAIRQAAFNAKMTSELRTDERGKGFFWITTRIAPKP